VHPQTEAYAMLYRSMKDQASVLSYIDTFWLLGVATGIMFVLSFFLNKNNPRSRAKQEPLAH
jgi:DHA2 family multidrug resistance protein